MKDAKTRMELVKGKGMFEKRFTLLRSQKKRVYEVLQEAGLEPADFSWSNVEIVERFIVSRLNHRSGQDYFQFSSYEMNAWCIACPGVYRNMDYAYPKTWAEQEEILRKWAETLKRELETPDPWLELAKYRLVLDGEPPGEAVNEPIPAVEAEQIGQALLRLSDRVVQELSLGDDQIPLVRGKLAYLADAARRVRSRDWIYAAMGVWASMAVALWLTEEQAARLWGMFRSDIGRFARLLPARVQTLEAARRKQGIVEIKPDVRASHLGEIPKST